MIKDQKDYYAKRAGEYELIYSKEERQEDLQMISVILRTLFIDQRIIEIACGTGYWTTLLAEQARSIYAIDVNEEVLQLAKTKQYHKENVIFEQMDYHHLGRIDQPYEGLFGGFIWSHIPKQELDDFVHLAFNQVGKRGLLCFIDNRYVAGNSTPLSREDQWGNTYQERALRSKECFEVLKNFPARKEVFDKVWRHCTSITWIPFPYYWMLICTKK